MARGRIVTEKVATKICFDSYIITGVVWSIDVCILL